MSHLKTQEEKDKFKSYILNSSSLWDRLRDILKDKLPVSKEIDYEKASWSYYQADCNGYTRAMKEVLSLLPIDTK